MGKRRVRVPESDSDYELEEQAERSVPSDANDKRTPNSKGKRPRKQIRRDNGALDQCAVEPDRGTHSKNAHAVKDPHGLRTNLLTWYSEVHELRGMPWRKEFDPSASVNARAQRAYEVWISEIMLQQTQVATVIPYYQRWMKKFPTICDLAASNIEEVNSIWKGLGYYSRASRLLAGAQKAVGDYEGRLPANAKDMEANIPGIGRYSAGAICSIAYGERVPVLDGNVHRLLSRLLALHSPPKGKATLDILWAAATDIVSQGIIDSQPSQHPGDINQALIELGSTVCKIREPNCQACPLQSFCSGYNQSQGNSVGSVDSIPDIEDPCILCLPLPTASPVTAYPMKVDKKKAREELDVVVVAEWYPDLDPEDRWFLLVRRPEEGLLAGLYEFPTLANIPHPPSQDALEGSSSVVLAPLLISPILSDYKDSPDEIQPGFSTDDVSSGALRIKSTQPAGDVVHVFSHIKKTYRVQWVVLGGGSSLPALASETDSSTARAEVSAGKGKPTRRTATRKAHPVGGSRCVWTPLHEVKEANIGTGVMKVWDLVQKLWV